MTSRIRYAIITLMCWVVVSSCTQLNYLREAQNHFSDGAALENKQLFGFDTALEPSGNLDQVPQAYLTQPSPLLYYQMALSDVDQALMKPDDLLKDQLLGHALALRTLCSWKLGKFEEALQQARDAQTALSAQALAFDRDLATMEAIEGLVATERAHLAIMELEEKVHSWTSEPVSTTEALTIFSAVEKHYSEQVGNLSTSGRLRRAIRVFEKSRDYLTPDHPMQVYLTQAQLASLKNWLDELDLINQLRQQFQSSNSDWTNWFNSELAAYTRQKDQVLQRFSNQLPDGDQDALYRWWSVRLFAGSE